MNGEIELTEKYERNGWPSLPRPDVKPPEGWNLSLLAAINRVRNHSLSPDGRKIAFVWDREEFSDIYVMSSAGGWARRLSFDRPAIQFWWDEVPYWSPDSKWLAFVFQGQIYVVPAAGGVPQRITDFTPNAYSPRWMPDSNQIVLVAVTSAHRGESFQACEFLMDYLKTQAPFWKKEQTPAGARWVDARVTDDAALAKWGIASRNG